MIYWWILASVVAIPHLSAVALCVRRGYPWRLRMFLLSWALVIPAGLLLGVWWSALLFSGTYVILRIADRLNPLSPARVQEIRDELDRGDL